MPELILVNLLIDTKKVYKLCLFCKNKILIFFSIEIQTMMGMLLFVPQGVNNSPYSEMVQENLWDEVIELFTRDACTLLGLSFDSLLNVR
jgi:hypothetical protein